MSAGTLVPCASVVASHSPWMLSGVANTSSYRSSDCACCSSTNPPAHHERRATLSLSDDESDADTSSPTSCSSRSSQEDVVTGDDDVSAGDNQQVIAPSMREQSPIDIARKLCCVVPRRTLVDRVAISTSKNVAELCYTGDAFSVQWTSSPVANTLVIGGKVYHAVQFHFHTPSEHTLDGDHEAMELHLVHQATDGGLAVVAVFFREGGENPFLSQFWHELDGLKQGVATNVRLGVIDPEPLHLLSGSGGFFRYRGSLTTPPYTEGVQWVVIQDIAEASRDQLQAFRRVLPERNARRVQPLNTREVRLVH